MFASSSLSSTVTLEANIYPNVMFIRLNFTNVMFSCTPRDCNKVANALAAMGSGGQVPHRL